MTVVGRPAAIYAFDVPTGPVSVASRSGVHKQGYDTVSTTGHTAHHVTEILVDATDLTLAYGFWHWMTDPLTAGTLLLDVALVMDDSSVVPVTFDGLSTLTVTLDGTSTPRYDSDVISETVTRGDTVAVRTYCRASTGTAVFGTSWYSDTGTLSWYQSGNHLTDNPASPPAAPGPAYANTYYAHPLAILGTPA